MINLEELKKYKKELNLNLGQSELNYIHTAILFTISKLYPNQLIFKGGTSLMICYNIDRFSEDLDFTLAKKVNLEEILINIQKFLNKFDIIIDYKIEPNKKYEDLFIYFYGPLYNQTKNTRCKVKMDISKRNDNILKPEIIKVNHIYNEFPVFYLKTMSLEEIFAEKVRAIITRNKARDIYDLDYLINRKVKINKDLINNKLEIYNLKFTNKLFLEKIDLKENIWTKELNNLLIIFPSFKDTRKNIINYFKINNIS